MADRLYVQLVTKANCPLCESGADTLRRAAAKFKITVNEIDIFEDDDIYGNGVNVAARLESIAEPGGIYVSRTVVSHASGMVASGFADLGDRDLKNIPEPVHVWQLVGPSPSDRGASGS